MEVILEEQQDWQLYSWRYSSSTFTGTVKAMAEEGDPGGKFVLYHFVNGLLHREDGPAIEWESGNQYWYYNDVQHRVDGPAIIYSDGRKTWMLNGKICWSAEEHFNSLTPEQQIKAIWNINEWR